jgi:hypothetical protein
MTTITLEINEKSDLAKSFLNFVKQLNFVTLVPAAKPAHKTGMEKALEDVKKGRVYSAKSVSDLMEKTLS